LEAANPWLLEPSAAVDPAKAKADAQLKSALENPQVRAELEQKFAAAEQSRVQYEQGLQGAAEMLLHQTLSEFPALRNISEPQLAVALQTLAQSNPEQYVRAAAAVEKVKALGNELHRTRQARAVVQQQQFQQWARAQDAQFEATAPAELKDPATRDQIVREIFDGAREMGITPEQLQHAYATDPTLRSAAMQRAILEAAMWRRAQRHKAAATKKPVPSVPMMRPGVQAARPNVDTARLDAVTRELATATGSKAVKLATERMKLLRAKKGR
jgi:hypothetical protein